MSAGLTRVERWDARLKTIFDRIDDELEQSPEWTSPVSRHPVRPPRAATANPEDDGLFDLGASFTAGFGSKFGPGYVISARYVTLDALDDRWRQALEDHVAERVAELLHEAFPGKDLRVDRDDTGYKIHGDLSLD
jgi:hypothetical protein